MAFILKHFRLKSETTKDLSPRVANPIVPTQIQQALRRRLTLQASPPYLPTADRHTSFTLPFQEFENEGLTRHRT